MALTTTPAPIQSEGFSLPVLQAGVIWLMFSSSFFVFIEPAPVDLIFVLVVALFFFSGLQVSPAILPITLFLLLYNIGCITSYIQIAPDKDARMFIITSAYMSVTAVFFALYAAQDVLRHMNVLKNGYVFGATIAAILGILGVLNIAGLGQIFSMYGRAVATFKDPNVFSTYLILPATFLLQGFLIGTVRYKILSFLCLLVIQAGLFLAFSRGAWISFAMSSLLMMLLTFALTTSPHLRIRVALISIFGVLIVAVLLAVILSIPQIRELFLSRATLVMEYDAGETGRFGKQMNAIPMLLERPFGFGPLQFPVYFHQAPHNTYINAFSAYGWLGGLSYVLIVTSTILAGFRAVLTRTPWQHWSIAVFCPLFTTILQSVQIDVDHWRHFYWMLGLMWGLYAASWAYERDCTARYGKAAS